MKQNKFPVGWDSKRVKSVLEHYESQSEEEAVAEDEAAVEMDVPKELVPTVRELMANTRLKNNTY